MFYGCALTSLNVSNWDISNVTNTENMFKSCSDLTSLILGNVTQEQYDWWYQRLVDAEIQNNVTITYNIV
jgi:surface protein